MAAYAVGTETFIRFCESDLVSMGVSQGPALVYAVSGPGLLAGPGVFGLAGAGCLDMGISGRGRREFIQSRGLRHGPEDSLADFGDSGSLRRGELGLDPSRRGCLGRAVRGALEALRPRSASAAPARARPSPGFARLQASVPCGFECNKSVQYRAGDTCQCGGCHIIFKLRRISWKFIYMKRRRRGSAQ